MKYFLILSLLFLTSCLGRPLSIQDRANIDYENSIQQLINSDKNNEKLVVLESNYLLVLTTLYDKDASWEEEWKNFRQAITKKIEPIGNGYDGMMANKLVAGLYASSKNKKIINF